MDGSDLEFGQGFCLSDMVLRCVLSCSSFFPPFFPFPFSAKYHLKTSLGAHLNLLVHADQRMPQDYSYGVE